MSSIRPTKEQVIKELWYRGRLGHLLHSGQKIVNEKYNQIQGSLFVCNISRQWGKSYFSVVKSIEKALSKPNARIKYATAFNTDLIEFILPTFDIVLQTCPGAIKPTYKKQGSKWVFKNGSEIKLIGLDKSPNSLRGNVIDLIVIDECGFVSNLDYIYKSVIIPATTHRPDAKIILISTPPATPAHAFIDYCQKAESEGGYATFTIYDNPMVSPDTIQRLINESGGEHTTTWRREYLCEFVTDTDLAIISEWHDKFIQEIPRDEFYRYYHKYVGMDLGVKDLTACIFGYYDFKRASLIIEDEFHTSGSSLNTEVLVSMIRSKEAELWGDYPSEPGKPVPFRRISDNNWPLLMNDFNSLHNLTFIATNKDLLEAMINEVRIMVQNGRIIVHPRCKQLIGCLKYGVWNNKKTQFARSTTYGHFDHVSSMIYLVRNLAYTNPIPASHGHESHSSWMPINKNQTANAKTLQNIFKPKTNI